MEHKKERYGLLHIPPWSPLTMRLAVLQVLEPFPVVSVAAAQGPMACGGAWPGAGLAACKAEPARAGMASDGPGGNRHRNLRAGFQASAVAI